MDNEPYYIDSTLVNQCKLISLPGKHVFFGYYDLPQISTGSKLLVQVVDKKASPAKDAAEIGYFDLASGNYHKVAQTKAWCWQQGSRLRWRPLDKNKILYNDTDDGVYVTKEVDVLTKDTRIVSPALYDISCNFQYGVSVNFARLQRLRPGYGYSVLSDKTKSNYAPSDEGVYLIGLQNNTKKLVVSLRELAMKNDKDFEREHYINHVSFSPNGTKFMFFHVSGNDARISLFRRIRSFVLKVITKLARMLGLQKSTAQPVQQGRRTELYVYDIETETLSMLEDNRITSHYCWRNDNQLMTTSFKDGEAKYSIYDLTTMSKKVIGHPALHQDGHPSFFDNSEKFIYDTYPDRDNYQELSIFSLSKNEATFLAKFYHYPVKHRDMRCDLHPRLWERDGNTIVTLDTTCSDGLRSVALIRI